MENDRAAAFEPVRVAHNETYFSMLPTATQYARNALFAGLSGGNCTGYPQYWIGEDERTQGKFEGELFQALLKRMNLYGKSSYYKITNLRQARKW